MNKCVKE